jgi:homoserine kinase
MSSIHEIRVRVPASSANLGPGFDVLGLALGVYLRCTLRPSKHSLQIAVRGDAADGIPADPSNLVWRLFAEEVGSRLAGNFELLIENDIPLGRGMGSSAAAVVAGLALATEYLGQAPSSADGRERLIDSATRIEGHPDNAAAAVLGGFVVSAQADDGRVIALPCAAPANIETLLVIPEFQLSTETARAALRKEYTRNDAVFNLQRVGLLLAALQNGRKELLAEAMRDRIHQPYRAPLIPGFAEILGLKNVTGLLATALSGAGPAVLAICEPIIKGSADAPAMAIQAIFKRNGVASTALRVPIDHQGIMIERSEV